MCNPDLSAIIACETPDELKFSKKLLVAGDAVRLEKDMAGDPFERWVNKVRFQKICKMTYSGGFPLLCKVLILFRFLGE